MNEKEEDQINKNFDKVQASLVDIIELIEFLARELPVHRFEEFRKLSQSIMDKHDGK